MRPASTFSNIQLSNSRPYKDHDNLIPPTHGLAVSLIHLLEPILPDLMEEPVDMRPDIRYNLFGIIFYWTYLIIPRKADSSESAFRHLGMKRELMLHRLFIYFATAPLLYFLLEHLSITS